MISREETKNLHILASLQCSKCNPCDIFGFVLINAVVSKLFTVNKFSLITGFVLHHMLVIIGWNILIFLTF